MAALLDEPARVQTLRAELAADPLKLGFDAMDVDAVVEALNATRVDADIDVETVSAVQLVAATAPDEFLALSQPAREAFRVLVGCGTLNMRDSGVRLWLNALFGPGTKSAAALARLIKRAGSRAEQLGLVRVYPWDVRRARTAQPQVIRGN